MKLNTCLTLLAAVCAVPSAWATNGMDLEGYGPVATAMGGASFAYDNGAAAMMNNPATLGLMGEGSGIGVALGFLGPNVHANGSKSSADAFFMPAIGYVAKRGGLTYGVGVYSQGGMGTEYGQASRMAYGTGDEVRSEVGVGRFILPLAYNVDEQLTIGGSLDWVWATMDLKMAASTPQFMAMASGKMSANFNTAITTLVSPPMSASAFRIDFSDHNAFGGQAFGSGFAGKLGLTYKPTPSLTVGATYHSKTHLDDMKTSGGDAAFSAYNAAGTALGPAMSGKVTIHNFQWPETYGLGVAYQMNDKWLLAADYKRINWAEVMKDFKMTFSAGADFADFTISQNWRDQNVLMIGAAYRLDAATTLRFGVNFSSNPVPDNRVNPLFPAIVRNHYTAGFSYMLDARSGIDFAFAYAPKVSVRGTQVANTPFSGVPSNLAAISHAQTNLQVQYGYRF